MPSFVRLLAIELSLPLHLPHHLRSYALVLQPEILIIGKPPRRGGIGAIDMLAVRGDDPDPRPRLLGISWHNHSNRSRNQTNFKQQGGLLTNRGRNGPSTGENWGRSLEVPGGRADTISDVVSQSAETIKFGFRIRFRL